MNELMHPVREARQVHCCSTVTCTCALTFALEKVAQVGNDEWKIFIVENTYSIQSPLKVQMSLFTFLPRNHFLSSSVAASAPIKSALPACLRVFTRKPCSSLPVCSWKPAPVASELRG